MELMRVIKAKGLAVGFTVGAATYGKFLPPSLYKLELNFPIIPFHITLYGGSKRPIVRNLYLIGGLWLPFYLLFYLPIFGILIGQALLSFYPQVLFKESFITNNGERLSGWLMFGLSVLGLIQIIKWLI